MFNLYPLFALSFFILFYPTFIGDATAPGLDELASLLTTQGLGKYTDVFLRHEVDLQTFATLTDEELKEIGIPTFGARKKLLLLARETKKKFEFSWKDNNNDYSSFTLVIINEILVISCVQFGPYHTVCLIPSIICKLKISTAKVFAHQAQINLVI